MPDFDFYLNIYHGSVIPGEDWPQYRERALERLAEYKRLYRVTARGRGAADKAVCAMAETLYGFDLLANGEGGPAQSVSIGSVSVSYGSAAAQTIDLTPKGQARELLRCARRYLDFYRGAG